ncbi:unnamed protein product [Amoebophrya sp. A25]|nr:unnamed protein product [Amoebophrya sp. A25]|eukprot:GSA25T00015046001.1
MGCQGSKHRKIEPVSSPEQEGVAKCTEAGAAVEASPNADAKPSTTTKPGAFVVDKSKPGFDDIAEVEDEDAKAAGKGTDRGHKELAGVASITTASDPPLPGAVGESRSPTTTDDAASKDKDEATAAGGGASGLPSLAPPAGASVSASKEAEPSAPEPSKEPSEPKEASPEATAAPTTAAPTAEPPAPLHKPTAVHLHAIKAADEDDLQKQVEEYLPRVDETLGKSLGINAWADLKTEMLRDSNKPNAKERPIQWMWISKDGDASPTAATADGLLAFRVLRLTFSSGIVISHFSIPGGVWEPELPGILYGVRKQLFAGVAAGNLRITLNYYEEGEKYTVNKPLEKVCKDLGFRWFQLTNYSNGSRGQVMNAKRGLVGPGEIDQGELDGEPSATEERFDQGSRMATCPVDEVPTEEEEEG